MLQLVVRQLSGNIYFPGALVRYIETTDLKDMAGDAYIMLVNIFDDQSVKAASPTFC